jgi:hypothetical protein
MKILKRLMFFSAAATALVSCGDESKQEKLSSLKHFSAEKIEALNVKLSGDTVLVKPTYDLYIDFSSTMKRGLTDKDFRQLIETAFYKGGSNLNCYSIGESKNLAPIQGDINAKKNEVLSDAKYNQMLTFMTPNLNNIADNLDQPAFMFTDFSVDEGVETTSMIDGVKSTYVRGPQFKDQFGKWLASGGSIRIYGKLVGESKSPIYVIAFLPKEFDAKHSANGLLADLDNTFKKDIYFNLHSDVVKVVPGDFEAISDSIGFAMKGEKNNKAFSNGKGEMHLYDGAKLLEGIQKNKKIVSQTLYSGLRYEIDSTSFIQSPVISAQYGEYTYKSKDEVQFDAKGKFVDYFGELVQNSVNQSLFVPVKYDIANKESNYNADHFYRVEIVLKGGQLHFNEEEAQSKLQYDLKVGGKTIKNNCLYLSLKEAMTATIANMDARSLYTINAYVKAESKK